MNTSLDKFISSYVDLSESELKDITSKFRTKSVKRNAYLLKPGEICRDLVFVSHGCLRLYYLKNDVEISVWFSFQGSSAIEIHSFISGSRSNYFLQAVEDTEVQFLSKVDLNQLYLIQPKTHEFMRKYWEDVVLNILNRFTSLQNDAAEQRYLDLLSKTELLEKLPQKYLASFLGMTPTSLSRVRRQIANKHKLP